MVWFGLVWWARNWPRGHYVTMPYNWPIGVRAISATNKLYNSISHWSKSLVSHWDSTWLPSSWPMTRRIPIKLHLTGKSCLIFNFFFKKNLVVVELFACEKLCFIDRQFFRKIDKAGQLYTHQIPDKPETFSVYSDLTVGGPWPMNLVWLAFAISLPSLFSSSAEVKANVRPILTTSVFMVISSPTGAARK